MTREAVASTRVAPRPSLLAGAAAGVASVVAGAGLGELAAAIAAPSSSPFSVVGGVLIDLAPSWAKDAAISLFGTNDKAALLVGIGLVLLVAAAGVGMLELRRPWFGVAICTALGVGVALLAMTRAGATGLSWLPSLVAGVAAAIALRLLTRLARRDASARDASAREFGDADGGPADEARRRFLVWTGSAAAVGVLAAIVGSALQAGSRTVEAVRSVLRLPKPAIAAPAVPAGAQLDVTGVSQVVTPNASFYRIDTALIVPQVDPATWSLRIFGLVEQEVEIGWDELLGLPLEESWTTLACVSNPVGGDLIGNAKWLGYPIRHLLDRARPTADADMVLSRSIDGFTAGTPLEVLQEPDRAAILAVGMNDEPLPAEHGFPVRMVVPGLYGYVSATKWVTELEVTRFDRASAYWTSRGWSAKGPVKLQSRIDVPRRNQGLSPGDTVIAGVAWQQHVGISKVEVQVDGGPWREAQLATAISDDTWVQWSIPWRADAGSHSIRCRATNVDGETQTEKDSWPEPDGATGWQQLNVTVA
ncbi:molybdopterin-dependent oxidoreductase [Microbacterium sp. 4R-513]|uniref:molybdopterin-dependent oxidoreductase n=1 Tax=Microbacterium sp. 4R-513 TaxID=2567934 RepID=UPI0013E1D4A4|nr:molybdopterin-dependent oxidoreductase [Microbacterium sp. 4R-513]QIG39300.1 molybdopterin-dependent oxidoreductase [Microbacterium sp. 4R-513]